MFFFSNCGFSVKVTCRYTQPGRHSLNRPYRLSLNLLKRADLTWTLHKNVFRLPGFKENCWIQNEGIFYLFRDREPDCRDSNTYVDLSWGLEQVCFPNFNFIWNYSLFFQKYFSTIPAASIFIISSFNEKCMEKYLNKKYRLIFIFTTCNSYFVSKLTTVWSNSITISTN